MRFAVYYIRSSRGQKSNMASFMMECNIDDISHISCCNTSTSPKSIRLTYGSLKSTEIMGHEIDN